MSFAAPKPGMPAPCGRRPAGGRSALSAPTRSWCNPHLRGGLNTGFTKAPPRGGGTALARRLRLDSVRVNSGITLGAVANTADAPTPKTKTLNPKEEDR